MNLLNILLNLENDDDLHLARLLILLEAFAGKEGTSAVQGLTKLAKLDFLLRYPVYLEQALRIRSGPSQNVDVADHERQSVESNMVRFRYGPWDFRYRRFINLLVAKGLIQVNPERRTVEIRLTTAGLEKARKLTNEDAFSDIARRAKLLQTHFDYQGTFLMRFIYNTFPEIATLRLGEVIES